MSRVIFVNRFYWPETPATGQLLTDLATATASAGRPTTVITSGDSTRFVPRETHCGVEIIRVRTPRWASRTVVGKAFAFAAFLVAGTYQMLRRARRGDTLVALTDPPLLGVAAWLVTRVTRASLVHWVQDIYPEVAIAVSHHRWLGLLKPIRNAAWRHSDLCVTVGSDMAAVLAASGVHERKIAVVPNWSPDGLTALDTNDPAAAALRKRLDLDGKFVVAYAGNMGRVHDLVSVVQAAALLKDDRRIALVLVGNGAQHGSLADEARKAGLHNVRFCPPQPRDRLSETLAIANVHLVTLRAGCEQFVFPSKLYGIAAARRPVLFVGSPECECASLVVTNGLGVAVNAVPGVIAHAIRSLATDEVRLERFRENAARFASAHDVRVATARWIQTLASVGAC